MDEIYETYGNIKTLVCVGLLIKLMFYDDNKISNYYSCLWIK